MRSGRTDALKWMLIGGLAFWLPYIVVVAPMYDSAGFLSRNVASLAGFAAFVLGARLAGWHPRWGATLIGLHVLGPSAMVLTAALGGRPMGGSPSQMLFAAAICLFPPMTLWLGLLNEVLPAVLIVSLPLLVIATWGGRAGNGGPPTGVGDARGAA